VTPLPDMAGALTVQPSEIGDPHYDDPSLALLFSQLKSKTLQTAKGTSEISGRTEFNFVLQTARVFTRMGCHALALDLVKSWSFARPSAPELLPSSMLAGPPSPTAARHSFFSASPSMRRHPSVYIDMDLPSEGPTRPASPNQQANPALPPDPDRDITHAEGDTFVRKAGLGSLMKSAKRDVQVPEFDMGAFF
jgi:hypothetical protein